MQVEVVSAFTALAAVVLSPVATIYVAKKQINANLVSANRQNWINSLRNEIAQCGRDIKFVSVAYLAQVADDAVAWERLEELTLTIDRIDLYLNPNEVEHQELMRLMDSARSKTLESLQKKEKKSKELNNLAKNISRQAQKILKDEWERVKRGD